MARRLRSDEKYRADVDIRPKAGAPPAPRSPANGGQDMVAIMNIKAEFDKLRMLRGRTPETPDSDRKGAFARLADYRDGGIFTAKFSGNSAWERHPNGDEIVQIVDGATTLYLVTDDGLQSFSLSAGMVAIVPQNMWHRFEAPDGVCVMTATPQPTEHLHVTVEDPRAVA
jgi:quercetin dioxygenase-like cupin family protein